jgi:hypothetical protein
MTYDTQHKLIALYQQIELATDRQEVKAILKEIQLLQHESASTNPHASLRLQH